MFSRTCYRLNEEAEMQATVLAGVRRRYETPYAIAGYIAVCAVISLVATAFMTDYTGKNLEREHEA